MYLKEEEKTRSVFTVDLILTFLPAQIKNNMTYFPALPASCDLPQATVDPWKTNLFFLVQILF